MGGREDEPTRTRRMQQQPQLSPMQADNRTQTVPRTALRTRGNRLGSAVEADMEIGPRWGQQRICAPQRLPHRRPRCCRRNAPFLDLTSSPPRPSRRCRQLRRTRGTAAGQRSRWGERDRAAELRRATATIRSGPADQLETGDQSAWPFRSCARASTTMLKHDGGRLGAQRTVEMVLPIRQLKMTSGASLSCCAVVGCDCASDCDCDRVH